MIFKISNFLMMNYFLIWVFDVVCIVNLIISIICCPVCVIVKCIIMIYPRVFFLFNLVLL